MLGMKKKDDAQNSGFFLGLETLKFDLRIGIYISPLFSLEAKGK